MDNDNNKDIKDVSYKQVTNEYDLFSSQAEIKFRNKKFEAKIKNIMKLTILVLVAALSGGVTAAVIIDIKYSDVLYPRSPFIINQVTTIRNTDATRSPLGKVADAVGPTLVGISNNEDNLGNEAGQNNGCGVVFDSRGYIVTNYHGIEGCENIFVKLANRPKAIKAVLVGSDPYSDLAVIKISVQGLQAITFGDSSKVRIGDTAIAIGNPLGANECTMTAGIISSTNNKMVFGKNAYKIIQTDAVITAENYGGVLCNEEGRVIAINLRKNSDDVMQPNVNGLEHALAINEAQDLIKNIMDNAKINTNANPNIVAPKVDFGIDGGNVQSQNKNSIKGVYVNQVHSGGSADKAGIKVLDIIIELDKKQITSTDDLFNVLSKHTPGDTVLCKVLRDGKQVQVNVVLDEAK